MMNMTGFQSEELGGRLRVFGPPPPYTVRCITPPEELFMSSHF